MLTIQEIRRRNLLKIIDRFESERAAAEALDRSAQQINAYTSQRRPMGSGISRTLEQKLGLPDGWFDSENSSVAILQNKLIEKTEKPEISNQLTSNLVADLPLEIPKLNLSDLDIMPRNEFVDMLKVQSAWLFSQPVATSDPHSLRIITATGDEMAPTIKRGDIVLLDISQNQINANGVYALTYAGSLSFSRTQVLPSGECDLLFDNDKYKPRHYSTKDLTVLGRCLLSFNLNPL